MTKSLWSELTLFAFALIVLVCTQFWSDTTPNTSDTIVGAWKSYSIARFGTTTAEFHGDGRCQFRENGGKRFSCKWTDIGHGQIKISVIEPGKNEVFLAGTNGDRLYVNEPGREPNFVRADSKFAYERRLLANAAR